MSYYTISLFDLSFKPFAGWDVSLLAALFLKIQNQLKQAIISHFSNYKKNCIRCGEKLTLPIVGKEDKWGSGFY